MRTFISLVLVSLLAACSPDLSSVNREAVCAQAPTVWDAERFSALQAASGDQGRALLEQWTDDARCRVYLLRSQAFEIAIDASGSLEDLKARAGHMTLMASQLRDHMEGVLDRNWMAQSCPLPSGEVRPDRRDSTAYASVCVGNEDQSPYLHLLLKRIEDHSNFSADDGSTSGCRAHSEHVLNCLQTSAPIDWDDNGDPQQMCGGDLGDYGLEGDGLGDYIRLVFEAAIDDAVGD